jgi:hypothetical protein
VRAPNEMANTSKFKVGDRVRHKDSPNYGQTMGTGTVVEVKIFGSENGKTIYALKIRFDEPRYGMAHFEELEQYLDRI